MLYNILLCGVEILCYVYELEYSFFDRSINKYLCVKRKRRFDSVRTKIRSITTKNKKITVTLPYVHYPR